MKSKAIPIDKKRGIYGEVWSFPKPIEREINFFTFQVTTYW